MAGTTEVFEPVLLERQQLGEQVVVGLAMGYAASQILFNSEELGLFPILSDGAKDLTYLADKVGLQPGPLERLLIACCALGLTIRNGTSFDLTDVSRACLLKGRPGYLGGLFPFFKRALYPVWEHLDAALREEQPQWQKVVSIGKSGLFEALYRDEAALREFHVATHQLSYLTGLAACQCFDFSRFPTIVDLGGGTGGFVAAVCRCFPEVQGFIFDLPLLKDLAVETIAREGNLQRIRFLSGDFFHDALPTGADLYILGDVLHDWNRSEGTSILRKVSAALPSHGAVCIVENLLNNERTGPYLAALMNLTTLVATCGQHHSPAEFETWLGSIGYSHFEHWFLPAPRDLFVGWKELSA